MGLITLTTDWGLRDYYAAAAKGAIYNLYSEAVVVDISHQIPPFDIIQASLVLKNSYKYFPKGTVHIVEVKAQAVNIANAHLAITHEGQYFIGADNGIFSLVLDEMPNNIVEIITDNHFSCFPTKDIYIKAACHLSKGGKLEDLGNKKEKYLERLMLRATTDEASIKGSIIYIDDFGNIITNISRDLFEQIRKGRKYNIFIRRFEYEISDVSQSYGEVPEGEKVAIFNSSGYLEVAINEGKASNLLGLSLNDTIRIDFYDN